MASGMLLVVFLIVCINEIYSAFGMIHPRAGFSFFPRVKNCI